MRPFRVSVLMLLIGATPAVAEEPRRSPDDLPAIKTLPNPFVLEDGSPVRTRDDWARRRRELKSLFEDYEYGHLPPRPERMTVARGAVQADEAAGADRQDLTLTLEHHGKSFALPVRLLLPPGKPGPFPVVIQGGFFRPPGAAPAAATKKAFTPRPDRLKIFADRGYAVAEVNFQAVAPDNKDRARSGGIYQLFGDDIDTGGLMAWAWAIHRVLDALEGDRRFDAKKAVATGHSRYGKAALVAGAFDERIALTVPSHSGCAGAAPYRFIFGKSEQLHNIVGAFPYWFRPDLDRFIGKVDRLPIDQHELEALVAPRALLLTEGTEDTWINPEGSQLTYRAARTVYEFLGAGDRIRIKFRPVGHIPSNEDLLDFADHVFFDKPLPEEFGKLAYPEATEAFDWSAPKAPAGGGPSR